FHGAAPGETHCHRTDSREKYPCTSSFPIFPFYKKTGRYENRPVLCWRYLFSRFVSKQVSSAQVSLTSVFGMGTGGPSLQSTPTAAFRQAIQFCLALQGLVTRTGIEPMFAA